MKLFFVVSHDQSEGIEPELKPLMSHYHTHFLPYTKQTSFHLIHLNINIQLILLFIFINELDVEKIRRITFLLSRIFNHC